VSRLVAEVIRLPLHRVRVVFQFSSGKGRRVKAVVFVNLHTPPCRIRNAECFHTTREKINLSFKASPPVGERFGEGSKSRLQNEKSKLMDFSFFV
jgi:hypothetical protein